MSKRTNRWAKGLMIATVMTVYQAAGCDLTSFNAADLQSLLGSALPLGNVSVEINTSDSMGDSMGDAAGDMSSESNEGPEDEQDSDEDDS